MCQDATVGQQAVGPGFSRGATAAAAAVGRFRPRFECYVHTYAYMYSVCFGPDMCIRVAADMQSNTSAKAGNCMLVATHPPFGGRSRPPNNLGDRQDAR